MATWLLLDSSYLAYRSFYSMGGLSSGGVLTGVVFGFFRDMLSFRERFNTERVVCCFDHSPYLRTLTYPTYKSKRRDEELTEEKELLLKETRRQVKLLRTEYLKEVGLRNIFSEQGYEADDIIASVCQSIPKGDRAIIIASDHDLFQLISKNVICFNPTSKVIFDLNAFHNKYGIGPSQWADVKAIAGCGSDSVDGIDGVGEVTAAKFIGGKLKNTAKAFDKIVKGNKIWKRNLHLVKLPYAGTPRFELRDDEFSNKKWRDLMDRLGMKSLRDQLPVQGKIIGQTRKV